MRTVFGYIRDVARVLVGAKKGDYEIEEIKIYFSVPDPHHPSRETLTLEKSKMDEANFVWEQYGVLFTDKAENFHIYLTPLQPWGSKPPGGQEVFQSDSLWSVKKSEPPSITVKEVESLFPKILKGPDLFPPKGSQVSYINTHKTDKGEDYSSEEFKRLFDNEFYTVLRKDKTLENPFGKPLGTKGGEPPEKPGAQE